jgi:hypothetical protein
MGKKRRSTFADLMRAESVRADSSDVTERHPGEFNAHRQLFDLDGIELVRTKTRITPKEAVALVSAGAKAASEGCGCGGWSGCQPIWLTADDVVRLLSNGKPRRLKGGNPAWIDVWAGEGSTLVFAHGDIAWV